MRLTAPLAGRRVIDGFEKAVFPDEPLIGHALHIQAGRFRRHHQGQCRGIGGDHQILGQPALESQPRHPEGAVLVVEMDIDRVVARFGNAPRHAALLAVFDLPGDRRLAGLVEQGVGVIGHDQQRHQVLEHRAAPRQQRRLAAGPGEQTAEREPALLRQLALGDGDEIAQAGFGGQQIVVAGIHPAFGDVVADGQQMPFLVEQELIVHLGEFAADPGQGVESADAAVPFAAPGDNQPAQFGQPFALRRRHFCRQLQVDSRAKFSLQSCHAAQGRHVQLMRPSGRTLRGRPALAAG